MERNVSLANPIGAFEVTMAAYPMTTRDLAGRPATRAARRRPATTRAAAFRNRVDERTRQSALAAGVI